MTAVCGRYDEPAGGGSAKSGIPPPAAGRLSGRLVRHHARLLEEGRPTATDLRVPVPDLGRLLRRRRDRIQRPDDPMSTSRSSDIVD